MDNTVFRKVSLERLSSPEELDQLITITSPRGWIALSGLIIILLASAFWGISGQIPVTVSGEGIITASEGVANIIHPVSGRVTDVSIRVGDYIKKGDIIARVENRELVEEINLIKRDVKLAQDFSINNFNNNTGELSLALSELYELAMQINTVNRESAVYDENRIKKQIELKRNAIISDLSYKLKLAVDKLEENSSIVSHVEGRVLEVNIKKGDIIEAGITAASIIRDNSTVNSLEVVLYVSPDEGKKITAGMDVHIAPTIVKKEDYGYMLGKVISVSEYPVSVKSVEQTIGNQELADSFSKGNATIAVRVNLISDLSTVSGFKWSTSKGPDIKIDSGNICAGSIVIEKRRPIEMVLPYLKKSLNLCKKL